MASFLLRVELIRGFIDPKAQGKIVDLTYILITSNLIWKTFIMRGIWVRGFNVGFNSTIQSLKKFNYDIFSLLLDSGIEV